MDTLSPAAQTVIVLSLFLVLGVPLLAWTAVIRNHSDRSARWWYGGLVWSGVGVLIVVLLQRASAYTSCCMVMSVLFCSASMRLELGLPRMPIVRVVTAYALFAVVAVAIDWAGAWQHWGVPWYLGGLFVVEACLLYWIVGVVRLYRSRGLVIAAVGLLSAMLVNMVRAVATLAEGGAQPLFSFVPLSMAAIISTVVCEVLMTLGYAMFTLEKANRRHLQDRERHARAEAHQRLAAAHAQELQRIIDQRDEMILMNSRFSAVSSLATFNSAIVHEISQPAQALASVFDILKLKPLDPDVRHWIDHAGAMLDKMAGTLNTLRALMAAQPPTAQGLDLDKVVQEILPIVVNEGRRRGHEVSYRHDPGSQPPQVQANKVLLERIVFNIVTNAFEALEQAGPRRAGDDPKVSLRTTVVDDTLAPYAVIEVEDNGPGFPPDLLPAAGQPFQTGKDQGMGMGLALARVMLEMWRGQLVVTSPAGAGGSGGTRVALRIPLAGLGS